MILLLTWAIIALTVVRPLRHRVFAGHIGWQAPLAWGTALILAGLWPYVAFMLLRKAFLNTLFPKRPSDG